MAKAKRAPAYKIPLNDEELLLVGRITILWGQIEFFVDDIICAIHGIDREQLDLFASGQMIGSRVNFIDKGIARIKSKALRDQANRVVKEIRRVGPDRNMLTHGIWGFHVNKARTQQRAGAHSKKRPKTPMFATQLVRLESDITDLTVQVANLWAALLELPYTYPIDPTPAFFFGEGPPPGKIE